MKKQSSKIIKQAPTSGKSGKQNTPPTKQGNRKQYTVSDGTSIAKVTRKPMLTPAKPVATPAKSQGATSPNAPVNISQGNVNPWRNGGASGSNTAGSGVVDAQHKTPAQQSPNDHDGANMSSGAKTAAGNVGATPTTPNRYPGSGPS